VESHVLLLPMSTVWGIACRHEVNKRDQVSIVFCLSTAKCKSCYHIKMYVPGCWKLMSSKPRIASPNLAPLSKCLAITDSSYRDTGGVTWLLATRAVDYDLTLITKESIFVLFFSYMVSRKSEIGTIMNMAILW